jgi:short-subunit dehydrogenase
MIARNHGQIVNIVSSGALSGNAFSSSYSSSTAALLSECYFRIFLIK